MPQPKESTRSALATWWRLMSFHKPRLHLFLITLVFMSLTASLNAISLATIVPFTEIVLRAGVPTETAESGPADRDSLAQRAAGSTGEVGGGIEGLRKRAEAWFYSKIQGRNKLQTLSRFCLAVVLIFLLKNLCWYVQSFLSVFIEQTAIRDLRNTVFDRYQRLSLDYFEGCHSGVLVSRITNDADLVRGAIANGFMEMIRHVLNLLTYLVLVLIANVHLFVWAIVILSPSLLLIDRISRTLRRISRVSQEKMARITSVVGETVRGIRIIKAFGAEGLQARRFMEETGGYCRTLVRMTRIGSLGFPLTEIVGAGVAAAFLYIGGRKIILEGTEPGYFLLFMVAFLSMIRPIMGIHKLNMRFQHGVAAGKRIFEVIDATPSVSEKPDAVRLQGLGRSIRFEDVWFEYEPNRPVLKGISLEIRRGMTVALVGPSGGGKSTLVALIPRFYDPTAGRITIDGIDLRDAKLDSLRSLIGVVTQETVLFTDTIRNNIRLGKPDATDEEVERAARIANAHGFIEALPDGYDTILGEQGLRLSGGERQRLTIARAVLKDPPILILDEATSALDSESERLVQDAIGRLLRNRTAIVIAHRLSTVRNADLIAVMAEGKIVETGSHEELLARGGLYSTLHAMQFAPTGSHLTSS